MVDTWLKYHVGERFDLDIVCRQLNITDRDARTEIAKKLSYEVAHENLEKSDRLYTYTNKTYTLIDWTHSSEINFLDITWPSSHEEDESSFGFDECVRVSPGDIIVIAGLSNMGKTLFCLNLLWDNMDKYPCTLMGNEYTAGKFKRRVSRMTWADPLNENGVPKFELIHRREDWKSIIRPNNINIIDWIALSDNFYQIGKVIDGIQSKLHDGIAIISLQKHEGKTLGMGGGFSEELASLYFLIDFERLTVRKCKEWHGHNPNGEMFSFTIVDGGTKFHDIRKVKKCFKCYGTGKFRQGECESCAGTGVIEVKEG